MSHYVKVRTEIREKAHLLAALDDLRLECEESGGHVRGDQRVSEKADIVVRASASADIGLRLTEDGVYEVVADWYRIEQESNLERRSFLQRLQQRYAFHIVLAQAREQNLVVEEEVHDNGEITITLSERG